MENPVDLVLKGVPSGPVWSSDHTPQFHWVLFSVEILHPVTRVFSAHSYTTKQLKHKRVLSAVRIIGSSSPHGNCLLVDTEACAVLKVELVPPYASPVFVGSDGAARLCRRYRHKCSFSPPHRSSSHCIFKVLHSNYRRQRHNCIRLLNINTLAVTTYSGHCAERTCRLLNHTQKLTEHWIASSVRYIQPQP